jgi:protein disulfide-isomerase
MGTRLERILAGFTFVAAARLLAGIPSSRSFALGFQRCSSPAAVAESYRKHSAHSPMKVLHALLFAFFAVAAVAADNPYNETADAKVEIKQALTQAAPANTPVIVVFGANWCGDCKMLDAAMKNGASASLLARDFKIVKVNVGRLDKNLDVAKSYGVPLENGIPAVAIISTKNEVLYVTKAGELADARKMGDDGIHEFFKRVTASTRAKK